MLKSCIGENDDLGLDKVALISYRKRIVLGLLSKLVEMLNTFS